MKQKKPCLRASADASSAIVKANILLSEGKFRDALDAYSKVIYKTYPGHPCALLNRALAYVALGYPELAAADANRVTEITRYMRKMITVSIERDRSTTYPENKSKKGQSSSRSEYSSRRNVRRYTVSDPSSRAEQEVCDLISATENYMALDSTCTRRYDVWTLLHNRYVGDDGKWCRCELASIVLCGERAETVGLPKTHDPLDRSIADELEVRAMYRLCGALWECGQGAVTDALGLVNDFENYEHECERVARRENLLTDAWALTNDDLAQFQAMAGALLQETVQRHSWDWRRGEAYSQAKVTMVNRVVYPWNTWHPDLNDSVVAEDAADFLATTGPCLTLHQRKETERQPYSLHLVAGQPLDSGHKVLKESTSLHAFYTDEHLLPSTCDGCGAYVLSVDDGDDEDSLSSTTSYATSFLEPGENRDMRPPNQFESGKGRKSRETSQCPTDSERGMGHEPCDLCNVQYCTPTCSFEHSVLHLLLCSRELNERLNERVAVYKRGFDEAAPYLSPGFPSAEATYLHQKLFAKVLALAHSRNTHPLAIDEVRWLNGKLFAAPENAVNARNQTKGCSTDHISLPWSFDNNIMVPAHIVAQLGVMPWENIEKLDGWVMNTLLAKIEVSCDITKGKPQSIKLVDRDFKCRSIDYQLISNLVPDLWSASIHPIASLALRATPEHPANITWTRQDATECYFLGHESGEMEIEDDQPSLARAIIRPVFEDAVTAVTQKTNACALDGTEEERTEYRWEDIRGRKIGKLCSGYYLAALAILEGRRDTGRAVDD